MEATPKMDNSDKSTTSQSTTEASMHNMAAMGNPTQKQALKQSSLKVSGNCDMCKARIEKAAKSVTGVTEAVWDAKTKQLNLKFDNQTNSISIEKAIATAGHDTPHHKALGTNYSKLPGCCKYRD
jgi:Cu(I)/Ag(I) efflux system membrane fusion protein